MNHALTRAALAAALTLAATGAQAADKIKVGFMLPYSGTYAALGNAIENGFKLYVADKAASWADARSNTSRWTTSPTPPRPPKMPTASIKRDQVDVLIGHRALGRGGWRWPRPPRTPTPR